MERWGRQRICKLKGIFSEEHPQKHGALLFKAWSAAFQVPIWSLAELRAKVQLGRKCDTARESCRALGRGQEGTAGESWHLNSEVLPQQVIGWLREAFLQMLLLEHHRTVLGHPTAHEAVIA